MPKDHKCTEAAMAPASETRPRISVAILALDEERDLSATIDCIDQIADEIIVGELKFSENSPERNHPRATSTLCIPWQHDFSAARNACLETATGDWILCLDAGEVLTKDAVAEVRSFVDLGVHAQNVYRLLVRSTATEDGEAAGVQIAQHRLLPNRAGLHFTGPVRESLETSIAACRLESKQLHIVITQPVNEGAGAMKLKTARRNLRVCEQSLAEARTDPRLWLARGEAFADLGEWEQAEQAFTQARGFAAEDSAELLEAFYGELSAKDRDPSLQESQLNLCIDALKQFPVDVQLLCTMGHYLHRQQRIDLATRAYQTAVRHGKIHPVSWHLTDIAELATICLSISLELEDRAEEARGVLEDALLEQPASSHLRHQLIDLHVRHGRRKEAIEQVGRFPTDWPHRDALANAVRGACLANVQNWTNAEAYLQTAFDAGCRDVLCLRWLLLTHAALEHFDAAQEILELWRGKEPKNPEVQKLTASLLTRKFGQTAQAVATGSVTTLPPHFSVSSGSEAAEREANPRSEATPCSEPEETG